MNREAECKLLTWKETSASGRIYTRCKIMNEPGDLPDGTYTAFFAGHSVATRKWDGYWMLTFLPSDINLDQAA